MGADILQSLRSRRHWLVRWLVAAMLLPLLLGVLPQPGLSAAASLERDLALSICSDVGDVNPGGKGHHAPSHDMQCVLCTVGCPVCGPALGSAAAELNLPLPSHPPALRRNEARIAPVHGVLRDGSPPRGPPVA